MKYSHEYNRVAYYIEEVLVMEFVFDIGVLLADLVVSFFSGDEWKKIHRFIAK